MPISSAFPATTLVDAYRNCDHERPLADGDPRYQDLSEARGDDAVADLKRRLSMALDTDRAHIAFVSHRGAGKTTELLHLLGSLSSMYFPYYLEANLHLDPRHITSDDLLLVIALGLEDHLREHGIEVPSDLAGDIARFFAEVVRSTKWGNGLVGDLSTSASIGGEIPLVASMKAELKALVRTENNYSLEVRDAFRRYPRTLIDLVNRMMDATNAALAPSERRLLIVIDNLDRYDPGVVEALLVRGGSTFRELRCHLIVTPPIALHYKPTLEPLGNHFQVSEMHTVRLRNRGQPYDAFAPDGVGLRLLTAALARRIDLGLIFPDIDARNRLILASGGALRELLRLVQESILAARGSVIDGSAVDKAIARLRREIRDRINANGWAETLARIADEKDIHASPGCMDVLFQRLALKFNGDGWYDIHPLVAQVPEVQRALAQRELAHEKGVG